jgi:hypothetical protein
LPIFQLFCLFIHYPLKASFLFSCISKKYAENKRI